MLNRVGFLQGRLSPQVDGRIQAFPGSRWWRREFVLADKADFRIMEWTLDHEKLLENPLMSSSGRQEIRRLSEMFHVTVPSLTGDCFMQAPFWKASGQRRHELEGVFLSVLNACHAAGIKTVVVPLVDQGSLANKAEEDMLIQFLRGRVEDLRRLGLCVAFESDLKPIELAAFIDRFPRDSFGINYDIGNSASLGFDRSSGEGNVHILRLNIPFLLPVAIAIEAGDDESSLSLTSNQVFERVAEFESLTRLWRQCWRRSPSRLKPTASQRRFALRACRPKSGAGQPPRSMTG